MSDKVYYYCINCQMNYAEKTAKHNDFKCSNCGKKVVTKENFPKNAK